MSLCLVCDGPLTGERGHFVCHKCGISFSEENLARAERLPPKSERKAKEFYQRVSPGR
ncbi:hypothetical protein J4439_02685 [Candidatus Woesearchaeota archaeon]|nr:hypothetical protein [Candidatus Woesearchaeota archaeon]